MAQFSLTLRVLPGECPGSACFHTAMCDLHHRPVGYPTGEGRFRVHL